MKKLAVIFYGRFQPPHLGHVTVWKSLGSKFGNKNVYVGTSNKQDSDKSPLTFEWKKKLWQKHGIAQDHVIQTRRNYNADEVKQALNIKNFEDFVFIVAIGAKDASRLTNGTFFKQYKGQDVKSLDTADKHGYYYIIPNVMMGGSVLNASALRAVLRQDEIDPQDMATVMKQTGLKKRDVIQMKQLFEFQRRKKWWSILLEGGAAGHMTHPFEDLTMKFSELKELINLAFAGKLQVASEGPITEKIDGQNLFASMIGGKVRFARNKGQLKNRGQNSMTSMDMDQKWAHIPNVRAAFMKAASALESGFSQLSAKEQKEIFRNGENWVNFELVAQDNPNVISYDVDVIIFHNIHVVDEDGKTSGMAGGASKKLFKIFANASKSAELKMRLQPPQIVKMSRDITVDFASEQKKLMGMLSKVLSSSKMSANNTLGDMLRAAWEKEISKLEDKHSMDIKSAARKKFIKRFSEGDKSYAMREWSQDVPDAPFIDDLKKLDVDSIEMNKKIMKPIELLVLEFGVVLLQSIDTFISANPDEGVKQLRKNIAQQISAIRSSNDVASIDKMNGILQKIDSIGGFDRLVPSEGLVFQWKGKLYKITGLFAPVNQLMGIGRFGR